MSVLFNYKNSSYFRPRYRSKCSLSRYNNYNNYLNNDFNNNFNNYNNYLDNNFNDNFNNFNNHFYKLTDYGPNAFVVDIEEITEQNDNFRLSLWTGSHLQLTLMSINPGESIGLERHDNLDQFIRIEDGVGLIQMGNNKDNLTFQRKVYPDYVIIIPAGTWHNLTNTGNKPLKLYSIYAPVQHPYGTVQKTKLQE